MAGQNPGSPTDFQYFYEDEVYKINNSGQVVFGLVLENYEANSSDQESDVETPIQKGEIRVVWHPSGNERVISEKTVGLADRSLMPGDVVRRMIAGKDTQRGYCRDIMMTAALQIVGTNHVIPCVASERLDPLEEFTPDLAVCLDSWVGTSKAVHSKLRLTSADGSRLEWKFLDDCPLQDYTLRKRRTSSYSTIEYYPGQVLTGPVGSLDQAQWLNITKEMKAARKHKMHEHKFTVEAVVTESVGVHWQCRALCTTPGAENGAPQQPRFLVEGEDLKKLKLLNVFEPCTLQVGDRNFLTITEEDTFMTKKQWRKTQSKYYRELRRQTRPLKTTASKDSKTTLSNHSGELTTKHSSSHVPSKPKKRASFHSRDSSKVYPHGASQDCKQSHSLKEHVLPVVKMDVEKAQETVVSGSRSEIVCPSIKIDPSDDAGVQDLLQGNFGIANSTTDETALEEKNDSGISPEPAKEDTSLVNGDSKSGETQNPTLNDDDSENWENTSSDDGTDTDSGATWSSRCSSSAASLASAGARGGGKRSPQLAVKFLRGKRLKRAVKRAPIAPPPVPSARVVVETLYTTSKANVVWQDGTIELGIPSTQLYPIHHLDGQECFPGDFVVSGTTASGDDTQISHRDYGVVQKVDHHGRTAIVKWYRTYTSADQPVPQPIIETEVSVYDLKDHPDFQYRPGTVVIRVANFLGTEANCTAGQVIDNFPSGRVRVWWVDGHTSMCWPQDLYKVGEYDSEEGELWAEEGSGSEDSWETQSSGVASAARDDARTPDTLVDDARAPLAQADDARTPTGGVTPGTEPASGTVPRVPRLLEPRVAAHIERGRVAMHKLEEMFAHDPKLQNQEIMRKLLNLYKDCRFLDRLMGTTFFHEDNFLGLLERVREHGAATPTAEERRVQEQVTRLFTPATTPGASSCNTVGCGFPTESKPDSDFPSAATTHNNLTGNTTITAFHVQTDPLAKSDETPSDVSMDAAPPDVDMTTILCKPMDVDVTDSRPIDAALTEIGGTLAKYKVCPHGLKIDIQKANNLDSSSEFVIKDNSSGTTSKGAESKGETSEEDGCSRNVCYKLCSLIHAQLVKVHAEVSRRRPALLAQFLNKLMTLPSASDEKLSYHFSVQYGALVVSLADAKNQKEMELDKDACMRAFEQCIGVDSKSPVDNAASEDTTIVVAAEENTAEEKVAEQLPATNEVKEASLAESKTTEVSTESLDEACPGEGFAMLESAPASHRFRLSMLQPSEPRIFYQAVKREIKLLKSDLPPMVWVRGYEDRIDLLSLMIGGPERTPYEDGLFLFDVQLGGEYPRAPPLCHYISYCTDRLNPNLYEDGKVCVSLLGTWSGRGVEVWGKDSSLLQVIVSLQGLILNSEPYFNEAGYEKHKGSQQGGENSRMYNEMAILKLVQSMTKLILNPPEIFRREIITHFETHALALCTRLDHWMKLSEQHNAPDSSANMDAQSALAPPDFPLIPASRGFCLTLRSSLDAFRATLQRTGIPL